MGSSLVFLGIGVVMFIIVFGLLFQISTVILGALFTVFADVFAQMDTSSEWDATFTEVDTLTQYLITLTMSLGIVLLVIKVIMVAGGYGRD